MLGIVAAPSMAELHREKLYRVGLKGAVVGDYHHLADYDGLVLSALAPTDFNDLPGLLAALGCSSWRNRPILADGWACRLLESRQSGILNCQISALPGKKRTTALLAVPSWSEGRFLATWQPQVCFSRPAPNIAVLATSKERGVQVVRQGRVLACGYLLAYTQNPAAYRCFSQIVAEKI